MPGAPGRVLVVDDSQVIRQLIRVNLELDGFEVMTACDGAECLERVHRFRPDVITLDLAMPRLDGLGTVDQLRLDRRTRHIPLLLVSASVDPRRPWGADDGPLDWSGSGEAGAPPGGGIDAVLSKPFEPAELVGLVKRFCAEGRRRVVQLVKPLAECAPASRTLAP
ncbi:response regulator [Streptomyces sp. 3MP-14]|uniref:Response regulator n=1 Tax=Streptomyces mimosae TaxID=2586635 RepID=A0A5N6A835_9ACTN|nr:MULTISPECIES: response regulator [Streptomyces]KAB8164525.1 response regulator [Streptomyces mimosae]KAB8175441.1 response regulator [Streptomyces sp. 3MP-14]